METPVIYFYSPRPITVSVQVDLPSGLISEWYPRATKVLPQLMANVAGGQYPGGGGRIEWSPVEVTPQASEEFPADSSFSHYYAARKTDSAPLRTGGQPEKLLFYRGVANFPVAIEPKFLTGGKMEIRNTGAGAVPLAVLFENRAGKTGYRLIRDLRNTVILDAPELAASVQSLQFELAAALTAAGLYPKEAAAMIETWRDSWFEEGMRVFYIVPRAAVDAVLPLKISPEPAVTARVFAGRVEVLSPAMRQGLQAALASGDTAVLGRYGRFLDPFAALVMQPRGGGVISAAASAFIQKARAQAFRSAVVPCRPEPVVLPTEPQ